MLYNIKYYSFKNESVNTMNLQANNFLHATEFMIEFLDNNFGEDSWEILSIKTKFNFIDASQDNNVHIDWTPKDTAECPICALEHTVLDNILEFECWNCDEHYRLADNSWKTVTCNKCESIIERSKLKRDIETGKWIYEDTEIE